MVLYITFTTYLPTDHFQEESNLSFVWFIFKTMGMQVPSLTTIKSFNSLDVNIAIRVTSLIVSYVFNYGYRSLLVAEDSPFLKNHTVSLL